MNIPTQQDLNAAAIWGAAGCLLGYVANTNSAATGVAAALSSLVNSTCKPLFEQLQGAINTHVSNETLRAIAHSAASALPIVIAAGVVHVLGFASTPLTTTRMLHAAIGIAALPFIQGLASAYIKKSVGITNIISDSGKGYVMGCLLGANPATLAGYCALASAVRLGVFYNHQHA